MNNGQRVANILKDLPRLLLVDGFFGDNGKERVAHILAPHYGLTMSGTGGPNSGRTIYPMPGMKRILHHLTVGIYLGQPCVLGNGKVINPEIILEEIDQAGEDGYPVEGLLSISERAHVIMPWHRALDEANEAADQGVGSTQHGIAYVYMFKAARKGVRMIDLLDSGRLWKRMQDIKPFVDGMMAMYGLQLYDNEQYVRICDQIFQAGSRLRPYITDTTMLLNRAIDDDKRILGIGVNGPGIDLDHGSYDQVTSSNAVAAGIPPGTGVAPHLFSGVVMITKAYGTRVGDGPFTTELTGEGGDQLRKQGKEFGSTTGRPRRCGWIDTHYLRYTAMLNRPRFLVLTKLDILSGIDPLRICTGYKLDGEEIEGIPADTEDFARVEPIFVRHSGWSEDIRGATKLTQLPLNAKTYIERVEEFIGVEIPIACTGPEQQEYLVR